MDILDIFYNQVLKEASKGRIDCYFMFNVLFECSIPEYNFNTLSECNNNDVLIPTLIINEKEKFDKLLIEYVNYAREFYSSSLADIPNEENKIKAVLSLIWSNATVEDFLNPEEFLQRRIEFFNRERINDEYSFYSESLDSDVLIELKRGVIENETPYYLSIKLKSGEEEFYLPNVYFGMVDNKVYVYALQNDRKMVNQGSYSKKMNRLLYKVNDGLDVLTDTFENYDIGNLKDVSSSFVLASNIALGIFRNLGIEDVIIPSVLITRWNAKEIGNDVKRSLGYENLVISEEEHEKLQSNLSEKLLRTFRRLDYHHSGINITSYPFELDSSLHMNICDENICNNKILEDTYYGYDKVDVFHK